jgi:raffinose/stachyose/melibiose transport system substrate-binding protein
MKTTRCYALIISALVILALILSACAPQAPAPAQAPAAEPVAEEPVKEMITLVVWDQFGEGPVGAAAQKIYDNFTAKYPHIKVVKEIYSMEQLAATARTALASGTGPDIIYNDVTPARELINANLIVDLEPYAQQYGWRNRFYDTGLSWTESNGKLFGLGLESEFVGIFINHTLFEQEGLTVPQTLSEALDICKTARERDLVALAHSQNPGWQNYFSFTMPIHNYVGYKYLDKLLFENEGAWNSPEMVRALDTVYTDMADAGCFVDDLNGLGYDGAIDLFVNGEALMFPTGTWIVDGLLEMAETNEITMMPWFDMETGQQRVYTMGMGSAYYISKGSKHPDEAALFLDHVFSEESALIWIQEGSRIPPVPVDSSKLNIKPLQKFVVDTLEDAGSGKGSMQLGWNVDLIVPEEFNLSMQTGLQELFAKQKDAKQQMDELQAIWDKHQK